MSRWVGRVALAAGVWAVVVVPMIVLGMGPRPALLALVVAGVAATVWCVLDVVPSAEPIRWLRPMRTTPRPLEDPRANQLVRLVEAAPDDPNRAAALRGLLGALDEGRDPTENDRSADSAADQQRPLPLTDIDHIVRRLESHGSH